jgi:hypothetical protein
MRSWLLPSVCAVVAASACTRADPPGIVADASPSIALLPEPFASLPIAAGLSTATATATATATSTATSSASADPGSLPQTRDRPGSDSDAFRTRAATLWDAITHDDPDRAMPFFFPVAAYEQVKDIPTPSNDWTHRLVHNYARDIHALHARLGDYSGRAKLVSIDIPDDHAKWVNPGGETNKIGYWRVFGSKLRYAVDGDEKTFDIVSFISWRGDWYVVHLSAIK